MASAIRDFSYLFIYSRKLENFGFLSRLGLTIAFVVLSLVALSSDLETSIWRLTMLLACEIMVLSYFRGVKATLGALRLVLFFILLGLFVNIVSTIMGYAPLGLINTLLGAIQLISIFMAFSTLFQLISLGEWRRIYGALGLRDYVVLYSMVMTQLPLIIYYASEAFTTTRLKYGGKKLYKFVIPLVLLAIYTSRNLVESYLIYGVPPTPRISLFKHRDLYMYMLLIALVVFYVLI